MGQIGRDGGMLIVAFIGVILAVVLIGPTADSVFASSNTVSVNTTVTPAAENQSVAIPGREIVGSATLSNVSTDAVITGTNFTVDNRIGTDGLVSVHLTTNPAAVSEGFTGTNAVRITYTAEPDGYLGSGTDRAIIALVILFGALGAVVFVITMNIKNGSLGGLMRRR